MISIADNVKNVSQRIQKATKLASRDENSVQLLAVTKTRSPDELKTAIQSGLTQFGENYLQEALIKIDALQHYPLVWHFIGPIQSNKTRAIAEKFDWVHSVDRLKVAQRLSAQRPDNLKPLNICIQVNINDEHSKSGIPLADLNELAESIAALPNLTLKGLMTIPAASQSEDDLRNSFKEMHRAFESLKQKHGSVDTLSMGMSGDIEIAIAEGSTMVRVGTALFGKRPVPTN
ncbi:YggS family pyridoxal phosphate-dependent enzyme [Alkalimarinus sediminis]|uniref:Pyridoxal phosphate homeostasis protein n=1 Tax=Alkalimarinus sediminis TaxID=1632866 RepID=A0A9E8HJ35_9ALTE|nr:YggS family pyridoxal phosphate-dependent enzyme [Alkalimarinus sediminis]UZW75294.1 YggS family pyridoxal phosphate-dependent enzyme [Alkalimarinus sediminis]